MMMPALATKATTPSSRAERLRARRIADLVRLTAALERGLAGDLHRIFNRIARHAARVTREGQPWAAPGVVDHYYDAIMRAWRARQYAAAVEMARHTLRWLGQDSAGQEPGKAAAAAWIRGSRGMHAISVADHGTPAAAGPDKQASGPIETKFLSLIDIATSAISNWVAEWGGEKVRQISDGTKKIIRRALVKGNELNEPPRVLAKRIRDDVGGEIGLKRAITIARTETHAAANVGSDAAATATGLRIEKEWLATEDHRTRPDHAAADGQRVPKEGMFIVGGEPMRFPGDPNASARQVVNCRCQIGYHPVLPGAKPVHQPTAAPAPAAETLLARAQKLATAAIEGIFSAVSLLRKRAEAAALRVGEFLSLTLDQLVLTRWYTGSGFGDLNTALRKGEATAAQKIQRDALNAALAGVKEKAHGTVYRRIELSADDVEEKLREAESLLGADRGLVFDAFASSSFVPQSQFGQGLEYVIDQISGVALKKVSLFPDEDEVLFQTTTKFRVMSVDRNTNPPQIRLSEVADKPKSAPPPRESKAKMTPEQERRWQDKMNSGGAARVVKL